MFCRGFSFSNDTFPNVTKMTKNNLILSHFLLNFVLYSIDCFFDDKFNRSFIGKQQNSMQSDVLNNNKILGNLQHCKRLFIFHSRLNEKKIVKKDCKYSYTIQNLSTTRL